jgi:hypothetical protein
VREDVTVTEGRDEGAPAVKMRLNFRLLRNEIDHGRLHCADGVIQTEKRERRRGKTSR